MEALLTQTHELLEQIVPKQSRYKVTERPDVRTIRYYISQGLLPKASHYSNGRAQYSGSHLLRLLLLKSLQAQHHTLQYIKPILQGAADRQVMARLLAQTAAPVATPEQRSKTIAATAIQRLALAQQVQLDIPMEVWKNPEKRQQLAQELRILAATLNSNEAHDEN